MIKLKRVYEEPSDDDGIRILVERLWPRGVSKQNARIDEWNKDVAPSTELREWFGHDPSRWEEFVKRYWAELAANPGPVGELKRRTDSGIVTFVYAAHDEQHNGALALKRYIER